MRRPLLAALVAAPLALSVLASPANAVGAGVPPAAALPGVGRAALPAVDDPHAAKRDVDAGIAQLEADLHDTDAEFAQAVLDLHRTEADLAAASDALAGAEATAAAADGAHRQALQDLALAQANEAKAQEELAATRDEIMTGRKDVAQFAAQLWMDQGSGSLQVAATAANPTELVDRLSLVETVTNLRAGSLDRLAAAQASQVSIESHLTAVRTDGEQAEQAAADAQAQAAAARDTAAVAKADLETLTATRRDQAATVQARQADEEQRLAQMRAESERLQQVLAERAAAAAAAAAAPQAPAPAPAPGGNGGGGSGQAPTTSGGALAWPLPGGVVTSEFGWRIHPITGVGRLHAGRDIATPCGQPVVAAADGVVVSAGDGGGYGNRVVLDHGFQRGVGLATSYNHLQSIAVWGGSVRRGQGVGYAGTTGFSTGCHLHFEVYSNGTPVDPRGWL